MEDKEIINLYNLRNEMAIKQSKIKYGRLLEGIAYNILLNSQDSEEVVNDTYMKVWDNIPPANPNYLGSYLAKITRNLSINLWKKKGAKKRSNGVDLLLSELEDAIPSRESFESTLESKEITRVINQWLASLSKDDRLVFLKRYWFGESLSSLSKESLSSNNQLAGRLYRLRQSLKSALERSGVWI